MRKLRLNNLAEATNLATEIGLSPPKMLFFPVISIPGSPWVGRGEWGGAPAGGEGLQAAETWLDRSSDGLNSG